jgi:hypothetical protein
MVNDNLLLRCRQGRRSPEGQDGRRRREVQLFPKRTKESLSQQAQSPAWKQVVSSAGIIDAHCGRVDIVNVR